MRLYTKWIMPAVLMMVCCLLPSLIFAQGDPGGDPDVTVPVDGGLSILAAAGVAYGVKKIKEYRKKGKETEDREQGNQKG
jgi:predicted metal-dependent HD superfamily phosphohydrolase